MAGENFPLGFALCIVAGFCNGSWQLPLKQKFPSLLRIVRSEEKGWQWENVWLIHTIWSAVLAIIYCFGTVGADNINTIFSRVSPGTTVLVAIFSFLWGFGGVGFGLAVKLLGMAIGTSLCMGVVLVLGTLLPLLVNSLDQADQLDFWLTLLGAFIGTIAFSLSGAAGSYDNYQARDTSAFSSSSKQIALIDGNTNVGDAGTYDAVEITPNESREEGENSSNNAVSPMISVTISVLGGVFASLLQFAFVFGKPLESEAENLNIQAGYTSYPIWLLAFTLQSVINISVAVISLTTSNTWGRFLLITKTVVVREKSAESPTSEIDSEESKRLSDNAFAEATEEELCADDYSVFHLVRKIVLCGCTAAIWMTHIFLYGYSQSLMGDLGAGVAWPLIMITTVGTGQFWSLVLDEWVDFSPAAYKLNVVSIIAIISAVLVLALGNSLT